MKRATKYDVAEVCMPSMTTRRLLKLLNDGEQSPSLISATELFGIEYADAEFLFVPLDSRRWNNPKAGPGNDATPKQVSRHIRRFVKARSAA